MSRHSKNRFAYWKSRVNASSIGMGEKGLHEWILSCGKCLIAHQIYQVLMRYCRGIDRADPDPNPQEDGVRERILNDIPIRKFGVNARPFADLLDPPCWWAAL
jgi:hypothetical protein